jgi:hypothetical protein
VQTKRFRLHGRVSFQISAHASLPYRNKGARGYVGAKVKHLYELLLFYMLQVLCTTDIELMRS